MRKILITLLITFSISLMAQPISLKECIDSAIIHYPIINQANLLSEIAEEELHIIQSSNLPQVDLTAKATWQSEVMELPIQLPGVTIPELNKDQYKIQLEISQSIYKGGLTNAQKELIATETQISNTQNNLEMMKLKNIIVGLYFQILLTDNSIEVLITQRDIIEKKHDELVEMVKAGLILEGTADALKAEILTVDQRLIDLNYSRKALATRLSNYTGFGIEKLSKLTSPENEVDYNAKQNRPEYQLFEYNRDKISILEDMQKASTRPMAYAFSTLGYGRPGFNYLNNDFSPYALVGVGVSWKLWNWNQSKHNIKVLNLKSETILNQQKTFELNLNSELIGLQSEITKQESLLIKAKEIIPIRERIMKMTESQFKQGIIRSSEYVDEVKKFETANLEIKIIEVRLAMAKVNYLMALGNI